jgi:hypothetical protein
MNRSSAVVAFTASLTFVLAAACSSRAIKVVKLDATAPKDGPVQGRDAEAADLGVAKDQGGVADAFDVPVGQDVGKDQPAADVPIDKGEAAARDVAAAPVDTPAVDFSSALDQASDLARNEAGGCRPLAFAGGDRLTSTDEIGYCPVDRSLPECTVSDVNASVDRGDACNFATHAKHPDCILWQRQLDEEYVFLRDPFGGCEWPIAVDRVADCGDHVSINYTVTEPCNTCDAEIPSVVFITIPNDAKPVRAVARLVREDCSSRP